MHVYTNFFGIVIPSYGLMIVTGVVLANLVGMLILKREHLDINDFMILEAYCFLGAFIGAKVLYLIVSYKYIEWDRILDYKYFNDLMLGGFVFYGGLIGGLLFIYLGGKIHRIKPKQYLKSFIFLIPFIHCFGRIGCFMAGCCYGVPYHGIGSVVFPEGSFAPSGIELFPVQLVEAIFLMIIAILILVLRVICRFEYTVELYLFIYGVIRFILEYFRYDNIRGGFENLSTSQWISLVMIAVAVIDFVIENKMKDKTRT
ncbi:prolipoprotein diacylglyceryl transferase [Butyrivibrio sp. YAB3001]|uniref:prolipoprotein diacylglyceryl transferase n=1 Tax=Butyrivibrio sp. YAB3001 TaxID=1520812 RepID=UPI0008F663FC|nr:prolipoprotein diacylglyceryl transferase family protein [Butyrivibrio sp. YAB3001]SFD09804.1 phosphatidylglycerol:prolipoprotein diacylglycerol transferase [Butyrivibrio sp. YAB3001]